MDEEPIRLMVHGLLNGQALCGFTREVPADWPNGHLAVHHRDIDEITCTKCRTEAEQIELNPGLAFAWR